MNLAQTIYTNACESAAALPLDLTAHDIDSKKVDAFKSAGYDPLDYGEWLAAFNAKRTALRVDADTTTTKLASLALLLTPSEIKAKQKPAAPVAPPA